MHKNLPPLFNIVQGNAIADKSGVFLDSGLVEITNGRAISGRVLPRVFRLKFVSGQGSGLFNRGGRGIEVARQTEKRRRIRQFLQAAVQSAR